MEIKSDRLKRFSDLKNAQKKLCTVLDETNESLVEPMTIIAAYPLLAI